MRIKFYLVLLFILGSALVYQSTSFTSAEITNETALFISPEEVALIAITYGEGKSFSVTNNTEKPVSMENDGNIIIEGNFYSDIQPGSTELYSIMSEPEEIIGGSIQLKAIWEGGKAEINSDIPQSNIDQILLERTEIVLTDSDELIELEEDELDIETNDEDKAGETVDVEQNVEVNDETNDVELNDEEPSSEEVDGSADNKSGE